MPTLTSRTVGTYGLSTWTSSVVSDSPESHSEGPDAKSRILAFLHQGACCIYMKPWQDWLCGCRQPTVFKIYKTLLK